MVAWIIIVLLAFLVIVLPFVYVYQIIRDILKFFFADWYNQKLFFTKVDPSRLEFLEKKFLYYVRLGPSDRQMFGRRVQKFVKMKNFEGRRGLVVTQDMETLVAASAIQITFGFPSVYLEHFNTILLFPESYYSYLDQSYHQGEVHSGGVIVLSWKNMVEGYLNWEDGRNLALHEMAHAMKISDVLLDTGYDFFDRSAFIKFMGYAREEMHRIANGDTSFFREYAASNDHEFFAVAIENFFERPVEFREGHQQLYDSLADLMNQNPIQFLKGGVKN